MIWQFIKSFLSVIFSMLKSFKWVFFAAGIIISFLIIDFIFVKYRYFKDSKREVIGHVNFDGKESLIDKLFFQFPRQYWTNYYNKKLGGFGEHGIIMFTGKQGQGKTLAETKYLMDMQYKYPSVKVYTNYGYLKEDGPINDWHTLYQMNNGEHGVICAIDECQNWFSSNLSKNFPPRMLATVTQNRKNRRVIIMSSHFFTNVAKPIRLHCTEVRSCRTFLGCFTIVKREEPIMNGDGDVIKMRRLGYYSFVHSDKLYNAYDTYTVIENLCAAGFKDDDNWGVYHGSGSSTGSSSARGFRNRSRSRSALVESVVNSNIDSSMKELL